MDQSRVGKARGREVGREGGRWRRVAVGVLKARLVLSEAPGMVPL